MFGASVVRQKRERERRDRLSRENDPPVIPYIKPFGVRFEPHQLPYFKYRQALAQLEAEKAVFPEPGELMHDLEHTNNHQYSEANLRSRTTANLNILLYVGLGTVAVGLIITFVGLGEKGFKTVQLKLIGPGLIGCGLVLTVIRIISCTLPACYNKNTAVVEKIKEEANGVIKNNLENENIQKLPGAGAKAHSSVNGKTVTRHYVKQNHFVGEIKNSTERSQKKIVRKNSSCEDDMSSSSTFSDTEDHIPPFLAEIEDKIEF